MQSQKLEPAMLFSFHAEGLSITRLRPVFDPRQAGPKRELWPLQEHNNCSICVKMFIRRHLTADLGGTNFTLKKHHP